MTYLDLPSYSCLQIPRCVISHSYWPFLCTVSIVLTFVYQFELTSIYLPGASYLFIVPALVAVVSQFVLRNLLKMSLGVVSGLSMVAVGVIWIPMEPLFYDAVGFRLNQILILRVAVVIGQPIFVSECSRIVSNS